jgi:hypothetical protein
MVVFMVMKTKTRTLVTTRILLSCVMLAVMLAPDLRAQDVQAATNTPKPEQTPRMSGGAIYALRKHGLTVSEPADAATSPGNGILLQGPSQQPGLAPTAPALGVNFMGLRFQDTIGYFPPDGGVAAGPSQVVQVVNSDYAIYDLNGKLLSSSSLGSFFPNAVLGTTYSDIFDPRVLFDARYGRWLLAADAVDLANNNNSWVVMAVSPGSDATADPSTWHRFAIMTTRNGGWGDYPTLGYDARNIYIGTNQFSFSTSAGQGSDMFAVNRAQAYGPPGTSVSFNRFPNVANFSSPQPIQALDDPAAGYFVSQSNNFFSRIVIQPIVGTAPTASLGTQIAINTLTTDSPLPARQLSGPNTIDTGDDRFLNAVYRGGAIWTAHTINTNIGGANAATIHWLEVNPDTSAIVQQNYINAQGIDYYYPMITVDRAGNAFMVYNRSSASEYVGTQFAARLSRDPANTFGPSQTLKAGEDRYDRFYDATLDPRNRWGDYNGIGLDPVGNHVWMEAEYAAPRVSPSDNSSYGAWSTWIGVTGLVCPTTLHSAASGAWSSPATWEKQCIPSAGNSVMIGSGHVVGLDTNPPDLANVTITGTLSVSGTYGLNLSGNWTNQGVFKPATGTVIFDGDGMQTIGGSTATQFTNLTINNSAASPSDLAAVSASGTVTATGTLNVTKGQFSPGYRSSFGAVNISANGILQSGYGALIAVGGDWTNRGAFIPNSGIVVLNGLSQNVAGSTTFYDLYKSLDSQAATLTFEASSTQTIQGNLTLAGLAGKPLSLRSSVNGTQWKIDPQDARFLESLDVEDSNNINPTAIDVFGTGSTDSGNNTNWVFRQASTTTLTSAPNPSLLSASVTITATVTAASGTPTGNIAFFDNGTALGAGILSSGQTTISTNSLAGGKHKLTASYSGSPDFMPSSSAAYTQMVTAFEVFLPVIIR